MTGSNGPSRRGRQAEAARNDLAVLAAARDVFAAQGADAPVAAIAERAGVGIGSLYRRYGSKNDLLKSLCLIAMRQSIATAEEALRAPDAWAGLAGYVRDTVAHGTGSLSPLAGTVATSPELWAACRRGGELLNELVDRAHKQGQLRQDATPLDVAYLIEMFGRLGPAASGSEEQNVRQRLLTIALDGLRATDKPAALPGTPPSAAHYESRWVKPAE